MSLAQTELKSPILNDLVIEVTRDKRKIRKFVKEALENKLHLPKDEGCFLNFFKFQLNDDTVIKNIAVAFLDGKMIAIAMKHEYWGKFNFGLYVDKPFRRSGVGTLIIQKLLRKTRGKVCVIGWEKKQIRFWKSVVPAKRLVLADFL